MYKKIVKNSVSNYPVPTLNASVLIFLNEVDAEDSNNAVYWIPIHINLVDNKDKTPEEIDILLNELTEAEYSKPEMQDIFSAIELGASLNI
jgi:hypothetical protein